MKREISDYINDLLFSNDCVIIPDFGGFVTSYKSAEIHPVKHQFVAPSKRVAFNEKLKLNDGLLISTIAQGENITVQEATREVEKFAEEASVKLRDKQDIVFRNIGKLFKNAEGRLQFKPDVKENYLEDSFGLPDFFSDPIMRDEKNIKLRNKYKDRKAMSTEDKKEEQKQEVKQKKKGSGATIWILTSILVLLSASAVYLFVINEGENNMLSGLFPSGSSNEETVADTSAMDMGEEAVDTTSYAEEETYMDEGDAYASEETTTEETVEEEPAPVASSGETFLTSLTGRYYVIAGAFSEQSNAEGLRDELISKGYDAKVLSPLGRKPLYRVSIADYDTQDAGLDKASTENPSFENALWVMKY